MNSLLVRRCLATVARTGKPKPPQNTPRSRIPAVVPKVPPPREGITTPTEFLKAIGRKEDTKFSVDDEVSWDAFFAYDGQDLKAAGVPTRDRRYILWAMQRFRLGEEPDQFKHELKKKKVRGLGPGVQNGKLLRSRRHKLPKKAQLRLTMHGPIMPPNQVAKLAKLQAEEERKRAAARQ
ncbi:hypothetical protein EXIGLDRAFT_761191 [Exidia glandulosa HHB12029]|uniref:Small ribosomal subunit protein mS41 n=1 Tax=Exidia glandulosa HHB12029 TaxID=1314781 RepID=A0A165NL42_EXIGL|nr:hypothetical protein EXIGLDRAFT_761191 [Exidia glandulosa HHB12029]